MALVICPNFLKAQHVDTTSSIIRKNTINKNFISKDTIQIQHRSAFDSLSSAPIEEPKKARHKRNHKDEVVPIVVKPHSAQKALLLSLIPGAGQIYNHQAWKIPIIYAALGTMGYFVYDNYTQMAAFKKEYLYRVNNPGSVRLEGFESYPDASIYNLYQSYNQNFQLMVIISAGLYALNLVDAFVFGHLFDFQINDDLTLSVNPTVQPAFQMQAPVPSLGFSLRF